MAADDDGPTPGDGLSQALAFAPPDTTVVTFTDWDRLKASHGLEVLDSTLPDDLRLTGMIELTEDDGIFSGYGLRYLQGHADAWGWDTTDLSWDAQILTSGAPAHVLRFRDDLDLELFTSLLDEREFESRPHGDAVIRWHDLDLRSDWIRTTELAIQNVAFLPDGHTVVASGSPDVLESILDAASSSTGSTAGSPAGQVAASLEMPISAAIELGLNACAAYSDTSFADDPDVDAELVADVGPLSGWEAMGVATYAAAGKPPAARLAFLLVEPETATSEAESRARLASEGHSLVNGEAYADVAFAVTDASAEGSVALIDLAPVEDRSRSIVRAWTARDLLPARCDLA